MAVDLRVGQYELNTQIKASGSLNRQGLAPLSDVHRKSGLVYPHGTFSPEAADLFSLKRLLEPGSCFWREHSPRLGDIGTRCEPKLAFIQVPSNNVAGIGLIRICSSAWNSCS